MDKRPFNGTWKVFFNHRSSLEQMKEKSIESNGGGPLQKFAIGPSAVSISFCSCTKIAFCGVSKNTLLELLHAPFECRKIKCLHWQILSVLRMLTGEFTFPKRTVLVGVSVTLVGVSIISSLLLGLFSKLEDLIANMSSLCDCSRRVFTSSVISFLREVFDFQEIGLPEELIR